MAGPVCSVLHPRILSSLKHAMTTSVNTHWNSHSANEPARHQRKTSRTRCTKKNEKTKQTSRGKSRKVRCEHKEYKGCFIPSMSRSAVPSALHHNNQSKESQATAQQYTKYKVKSKNTEHTHQRFCASQFSSMQQKLKQ